MTRRSGLGRGLDALLPSQREEGAIEEQGALREVPLDAIQVNPQQPRATFDEVALEELAHSIRELGILQAPLVRDLGGGRYELVAGERRVRAAKLAGLTTIPIMLVDTDDGGSLERALVENIHREDLNPIEEAAAYKQLIDEGGLTQEELATKLGKNRVSVTVALRLLDLPVSVQRYLIDGRITAGHGRALLGLEGNPFMEKLARRVAEEKMSVRDTEALARKYQEMSVTSGSSASGGTMARRPEVAEAQRKLADHLQTRVRVSMGKRKGKIELDFVSLNELDRLLTAIIGDDQDAARLVSPE